MTSLPNLNPLNFDENMHVVVGISKGTYVGLEPLPTKEELIAELKLEGESLPEEEAKEQIKIIQKIERMTAREFLAFYENVTPLEIKNDTIVEVTNVTKEEK